jgi:hypothetical protein
MITSAGMVMAGCIGTIFTFILVHK